MRSIATITDVIDAFKQQGFKFIGKSDDGRFKLQGQLIPPKLDKGWPCEVQIDPAFFDLPRIRLLDVPPGLPKVIPHLGANGNLCYLANGTIVLDIYDPLGQSLACLQRAAVVLGQILKGEMIEDLAEEFFAYWKGAYSGRK
ncbi:E2/UBC family protein [Aeromonas caviae]|uniref:E2/UBC family protein n=1 Tax=Aeromonas caviae TaxID=648 RepID=UPI002B48BCA5|nr:E2/UBC family protein [Aeromonas caviae]